MHPGDAGAFREVFARDPLGRTCFMWFDSFRPIAADADARARIALAEAAVEVLTITSEACQAAALHGLGHFEHPRRREWIARFIHTAPTTSAALRRYLGCDLRDYARMAVDGRVL